MFTYYKNSYEFYKSIFYQDTTKELYQLFKSTKRAVLKAQKKAGRRVWNRYRTPVLQAFNETVTNNYQLYIALLTGIAENKKEPCTLRKAALSLTYNERFSVITVLLTIERMHVYDKELKEKEAAYVCKQLQDIGKSI